MSIDHIGIILDGNRRFAKRLMMQPWKGHEYGINKVEKLFNWGKELGIKELTLYVFSMQNFNRPQKEFDYLMKLFLEFFSNEMIKEKIYENKIKIRFIGRTHLLPEEVYSKIIKLMDETKDYDDYIINFAMAYGGQEEVVDAVKMLIKDIKKNKINEDIIDEELFENYLYLKSKPDLIIRTGGDHRTSNFLIWQSNYSEWFFLDKFWPEFEKEDLMKVIDEFNNRERRFGK
ncbi:MAG: polyprenyl diphosphate synthase [Nanoarchaeota archaeon]|nr:di-trans,poly-cis-decaprenylcistransferase [Nanoarchaeota archaeon]MBU1631690.1 di-trans,poly-cis-decaprenylcistransferase [Nanoarchaeota archaeon]MBU1876248.1 di-trans,poly-cis-decaprenylcistransferase [Nanoarchaeota archaeon]